MAGLSRLNSEEGSFFIEMMIGTFIFFIAMLALLGMFATGAKLLAVGQTDTLALQLANQLLERVRTAEFNDIDYAHFAQDEDVSFQGINFNVHRVIEWVDDPADGVGFDDASDGGQDFKHVAIWARRPGKAWVKLSSDIKLMSLSSTKPTIEYKSPSPHAGSRIIMGGPRNAYSDQFHDTVYYQDAANLTSLLQIPLVVDAWDATGTTTGLSTIGFYYNGSILNIVSGAHYGKSASFVLSPTLKYWTDDGLNSDIQYNGIVYWNPFTLDSSGTVYPDGEYQIAAQAWNTEGGRDSRTITYVLDKYAPVWPSGSWLNAERWQDPWTVKLTWDPTPTDGIEDVVEYNVYDGSNFVKTVVTIGQLAYVTGLAQWSTHTYKIQAVSEGGRTSAFINASTPVTTMIELKYILVKVSGKYNVVLSWTKPIGVTVSKYELYRTGWTTPQTIINNDTNVSYTDVRPGSGTYTYYLVATLADGHTNVSPNVTVTVP